MLRHYTTTNANINSVAFRLDQARSRRPRIAIEHPVVVLSRLYKRDRAAAAAAAAAGNTAEAERLNARAANLKALAYELNEVL